MQEKASVVVILGATGVGKSRLAIDLACKFGGEIINADSMQAYKGLDILTNKVPLQERADIPHHLLGVVEPNEEFTVKSFRDLATLVIDDIVRRDKLPIVVGGTNYYIQALVSAYLLDDFLKETHSESLHDLSDSSKEMEGERSIRPSWEAGGIVDAACFDAVSETGCDFETAVAREGSSSLYEELKTIDKKAAGGIHPNNTRKLNQLISLYKRTGRKPSELLDSSSLNKWGTAESFRYNCCFICLDAELSVVDRFVEQRVDAMMQAGLLHEVSEFYAPGTDFTRGLHQAIGVSEFSSVFSNIFRQMEEQHSSNSVPHISTYKKFMEAYINNHEKEEYATTVLEAVERMKSNTRRLVRIQRRRFNRLEMLFKWKLNRVDVTNVLRNAASFTNEMWLSEVVRPSVSMVDKFLEKPFEETHYKTELNVPKHDHTQSRKRFICEVCSSRVFIGSHQWQEHIKARSHRKRAASVNKVSSDFK